MKSKAQGVRISLILCSRRYLSLGNMQLNCKQQNSVIALRYRQSFVLHLGAISSRSHYTRVISGINFDAFYALQLKWCDECLEVSTKKKNRAY